MIMTMSLIMMIITSYRMMNEVIEHNEYDKDINHNDHTMYNVHTMHNEVI